MGWEKLYMRMALFIKAIIRTIKNMVMEDLFIHQLKEEPIVQDMKVSLSWVSQTVMGRK